MDKHKCVFIYNYNGGKIVNNTNHALPNQEKWIKLSYKEVKHIFLYYIGVLLFSILLCGWSLYKQFPHIGNDIVVYKLMIIALGFGLLGSSLYYIRKLYKSCIQLLVEESNDASILKIGAKMYFYLRPLIGAIVAALVILGVYGGFFVLQDRPPINTEKFYVFSALFSALVGFSNGKIIVRLDSSMGEIAESIKIGRTDMTK